MNQLKLKFKNYNFNKLYLIAVGFFFLVLPWQTRWIIKANIVDGIFLEYGTLSLYLSDVAALLLILVAFLRFYKNKWIIKPTWLLISALELFVFISIFVSSDWIYASLGYIRFVVAIGVFWALRFEIFENKYLKIIIYISVLLPMTLAIMQFHLQWSPASTYLGLASHIGGDLGTAVVETANVRFVRAYGSFDHPNMLGGYTLIVLLISLIQYLKNKESIYLPVLITISTWTLFISWSRSAWLAMLVAIFYLLALKVKQKRLLEQKKVLFIVLIISVVYFIMIMVYSDLFYARVNINNRIELRSVNERVIQYGQAREIIKENWFFGSGIGNYTTQLSRLDESQNPYSWQPVHNVFLLVWAEIGIVGFIFYLWLISSVVQKLINTKNFDKIAIVLALIVLMMLDHWLWSLHFGMMFFWLVVNQLKLANK